MPVKRRPAASVRQAVGNEECLASLVARTPSKKRPVAALKPCSKLSALATQSSEKRRRLSGKTSSSGVLQSADYSRPPLDVEVLRGVSALGRYPVERKRPMNLEEEEENKLARKIRRNGSKLQEETKRELKQYESSIDEKVLGIVKQYGCLPTEIFHPKNADEERQRSDAQFIRRNKTKCCEATREQLMKHETGLDEDILTRVRAMGRLPQEVWKVKSEDEKNERRLALLIRKHWKKLRIETREELASYYADAIGFCVNAAQQIRETLRSDAPSDLIRRSRLLSDIQKMEELLKEKTRGVKSKREVSDSWQKAGIRIRPKLPAWIDEGAFDEEGTRKMASVGKLPLASVYYALTHQLIEDAQPFLSKDALQDYACNDAPKKRLYSEFFAACRSVTRRKVEPFPAQLNLQCGFQGFRPYQCLRQLALIEVYDLAHHKPEGSQ